MTQNYDELIRRWQDARRGLSAVTPDVIVQESAAAIRTLQSERDAAYARGFSAALEAAAEYMNSFENCDEFGEAYAAAILQLKRPEL